MRRHATGFGVRRRTWLLAAAALAAGVTGALADPLPRVAPSKPAGACGPGGGLALPGSATCLRLGGFARAEAAAGAPTVSAAPGIVPAGRFHRRFAATLRPEARVDAEARTETPYGPLRAYLSVRAR